jgi:hypothetical protein
MLQNFNIRYSAGNSRWAKICWSAEQNKFVAISTHGTNRALISSNGINWTEVSGVPVAGWHSICWSKEVALFVAVANSGPAGSTRVMTSPNGTNWTERPNPHPTNQWFDVCWSPQLTRFVAIAEWSTGNNNRVMTSSNGTDWTAAQSPPVENWRGVCWSPELTRFVAVAGPFGVVNASNRVMTSPDGFTWTYQPSPASSWIRVCWSSLRRLFVAVADSGTHRIMTSPDGFTWTVRSAPNAEFRGICWSHETGLFVGVCWAGPNRVWTSTDGITWTPETEKNPWYDACWSKELNMFAIVNWGITVATVVSNIYTFTTVGSTQWQAPTSGNVQVLIVAGGGGGGPNIGGGGGGGGVVWITSTNVISGTSYNVFVGDGGASQTNGQNSTIFGATAAGGGTSGQWPSGIGTSGGSGGGAAANNDLLNQGGDTSGNSLGQNNGINNVGVIYGNRGGNMLVARAADPVRAAGGGGAGGQGINTNSNFEGVMDISSSGSGGIGIVNSILGPSYYWGGGGGGAAYGNSGSNTNAGWGGLGGGGGGSTYRKLGGIGGGSSINSGFNGSSGTNVSGGAGGPNTGGGGGGGSYPSGPGGKGGSGIVVIRYIPPLPSAPTIGIAIAGNTTATVNWTASASNGTTITGYMIERSENLSTWIFDSSANNVAVFKIVTGLVNGKIYYFRVYATSNFGNSPASSASNLVLPIAMSAITIGSHFIGKTLVIGSTALIDSNPIWARIFDFHDGTTSTYIFAPFRVHHGYLRFVARPFNSGEIIQEYTNYIPTITIYYIYTIVFLSLTELKVNVYEYTKLTNVVSNRGTTVKTINMPNTILPNIFNFWLGRSIYPADHFYNGIYDKVALYNGDLLALSEANVLSTLRDLVMGTQSNSFFNSTTSYSFRPAINNFMGVVVNILNHNTGAGSNVTTSNITLSGNGNTSGGYLNIIGSFAELPTAPTSLSATPRNGRVDLSWNAPLSNGGTPIIDYEIRINTNPVVTLTTTNTFAIITGLTNSITYSFDIRARNDVGYSSYSAISSAKPFTIPGAPRNVNATAGNGRVDLSWNAPNITSIFTIDGSSTFIAPMSGTVEVLIVGGGGGGGGASGGGGGGGGIIYIPSVSVTVGTNYSIFVGDGGAAMTNGQNSRAFTATAAGGGTSGFHPNGVGTAGGSGGGAAAGGGLNQGGASSGNSLGSNSGFIYGNRGGNMTISRSPTGNGATRAAGGGGAGGQGIDTDPNITGDLGQFGGGAGGDGIVNPILGPSYYWGGGGGGGGFFYPSEGWGGRGGGGGGGGTGGLGRGGGSALNSGAAGSGLDGGAGGNNTGGGGGGGGWVSYSGGKGGSGIVVIRYINIVDTTITSYTVTSSPGGQQIVITNRLTTTATFSGLTNGTAYTFTVVAKNSNDDISPLSTISATPISATIPTKPLNLTGTPGVGFVDLSWNAPSSDGGSNIISYTIQTSTNQSLWTDSSSHFSERFKRISNLANGVLHYFRVCAINLVGNSPFSDLFSTTPIVFFTLNVTQNFVGGRLDISNNYTQSDISFNWYSSIDNSFTSPILLSNPNNRKYLFIRLEYQKLYIRCTINYNTNTFTTSSALIPEKYNAQLFDYNINIYTVGQKQALFNTATYNYSNANIPPVFNIELNLTQLSTFLSDSRSITSASNSSINTNAFETNMRPFGERLLEIIAVKIFGHPKTRAAISNDNSFYNTTQISTQINNTFNNHRNELGNYFMGLYDITQVNNNAQLINVSNLNIIFPFFFRGTIQKNAINLFRNGPNVGGSLLVNGNYNIPLLLTFN